MSKDVSYCKNMKNEKLEHLIETLRDTLNEICCSTLDVIENDKERLRVSRNLDELIVEYMKQSVNIN